jgi:hypothetical protein
MWGWLRHNFSSFRRAAQCGSGSFAIENACLPEREKEERARSALREFR